ncbi:DNA-directed RNA polymerases I and III subunit RPAC2-like [Babylonia areolata]|uniref:DNA-directed RNA polymerases I and III subunit RPAC2-like n=1 Tax=Babylonia areolata TaxID=304850 RepID=UPI003FCF52F7
MSEKKKERIEVLPSPEKDDETMCTFVLHDEDHTLGNSLRYMIMKNPNVEFCGYNVPHPSEKKIHLRVQTYPTSDMTAMDAFKKGLKDLSGVCSHIISTFQTEVAHYKSTHPSDDEDGAS